MWYAEDEAPIIPCFNKLGTTNLARFIFGAFLPRSSYSPGPIPTWRVPCTSAVATKRNDKRGNAIKDTKDSTTTNMQDQICI